MTIRLQFQNVFGPFEALDPIDIADFTVLTGLNGSGKTQLLRSICHGQVAAIADGHTVERSRILYIDQLIPGLKMSMSVADAVAIEENAVAAQARRRRRHGQPVVPFDISRIAQIFAKEPSALIAEEVEAFAVAVAAEARAPGQPEAHFNANIAQISMGYLRTYYHRLRAETSKRISGDASFDSIISKPLPTVPPWVLVSSILEPFGFRIVGPELSAISAQTDLSLQLKTSDGHTVAPETLSGGEQLLLALAIAQYKSSTGGGFPELLLLDESLSRLHPSIIVKALSTLNTVFVQNNRTRIVLVTHAPTLAALAPEGSLFAVVNSRPKLVIQSVSPDDAIGMLTDSVPSLRIDLENRRQVFVESEQDAFVYERAYQVLRPDLEPQASLQFIPSSKELGGNCLAVYEIVAKLRSAGVKTVRGIVDWDNEDRAQADGVEVLGKSERYALENLILDPLVVAVILTQSDDGRAALGGKTRADIETMRPEGLQALVDHVLSKIHAVANGRDLDTSRKRVRYLSIDTHETVLELELPRWALITKGHTYAEWVVRAFPCLQRYHAGPTNRAEDKVIAGIVRDLGPDLRPYLPSALLELFRRLQARS